MGKLIYLTSAECSYGETPYGYEVVYGIEQYNGAKCRGKVIVKMDLFQGLTRMFCPETLSKYRNVIYHLAAGSYRDKGKIAELFTALYKEDVTLQDWLGESYYFSDVLKRISTWNYFVESTKEEIDRILAKQIQVCNAKFICTSSGEAYFAVDDFYSEPPVRVLKGLSGKVVSSAKAWQGSFQEVG